MKRIKLQKKKKYFDNKIGRYRDLAESIKDNFNIIFNSWRQFDRTHALDTIRSYLENLKKETHVSKLSLAAVFTSDKILKLVDKYQESVTRSQDNIRQLITFKGEMMFGVCEFYLDLRISSYPLLRQWLTKQNDLYNRSSDYEKAAMERYFTPNINSSIYWRMLRHDRSLWRDCLETLRESYPSYNFTTISTRQLTTFKNKLDSFLQKSRLDGTFFRYVRVV